jgi:hypothetical protein
VVTKKRREVPEGVMCSGKIRLEGDCAFLARYRFRRQSQFVEQVAEMVMRLGKGRGKSDCMLEPRSRLGELACRHQSGTERVLGFGMVWIDRENRAINGFRFGELPSPTMAQCRGKCFRGRSIRIAEVSLMLAFPGCL